MWHWILNRADECIDLHLNTADTVQQFKSGANTRDKHAQSLTSTNHQSKHYKHCYYCHRPCIRKGEGRNHTCIFVRVSTFTFTLLCLLTSSSIRDKYGFRIESTPRTTIIITRSTCRTRRPQAVILGLLLTRPFRSMRLQTPLTDSRRMRGPPPPLRLPP